MDTVRDLLIQPTCDYLSGLGWTPEASDDVIYVYDEFGYGRMIVSFGDEHFILGIRIGVESARPRGCIFYSDPDALDKLHQMLKRDADFMNGLSLERVRYRIPA